MKRFLWGVEGVRLVGNEEKFVGGVRDREGSWMVVECVESGDNVGGVR